MENISYKYITGIIYDIYDYSKGIEGLFKTQNNFLWNNFKEIEDDVLNIIKALTLKYYFKFNVSLNNQLGFYNSYIIYFKDYIEEYFKDKNKSYNYSNALLSIIILFAFYLRRSSEYCETSSDAKDKIIKYIDVLKRITSLNIQVKSNVINNLVNTSKQVNIKSKKFFNEFENLSYQNNYYEVNKKLNYKMVQFEINKEELNKYNKYLVSKFDKRYNNRLLEISYHLLGLKILKESLIKENNNYLVNVPIPYLKRKNGLKIFNSPVIKHKICFLINIEDYTNNKELINNIKNESFDIVIEINNDEDIKLLDSQKVLVDKHFKKRNSKLLEELKEKNIEIIENQFKDGVENGTI